MLIDAQRIKLTFWEAVDEFLKDLAKGDVCGNPATQMMSTTGDCPRPSDVNYYIILPLSGVEESPIYVFIRNMFGKHRSHSNLPLGHVK